MATFSYRNVTENAAPRAFFFTSIAAAEKRMAQAKAENPGIDFEIIQWVTEKVSRRYFNDAQRPYHAPRKEATGWKKV